MVRFHSGVIMRIASLIIFLNLILFFAGPIQGQAGYLPPVGQEAYVPGQVLVKFKSDTEQSVTLQKKILSTHSVQALRHFPLTSTALVPTIATESVHEAAQRLMQMEEVELAEPNYKRYLLETVPNDPNFFLQWGHQNIQSTMGWNVTTGHPSVIVAVADTGIDYTHEDIRDNMWSGLGRNFIDQSNDPMDTNGHGTHVAGIIGAVGNNARGIAGVNWRVSLMALKFIGPEGGTVADEIQAIEYAMQRGVRVFNMSFGSYQPSVIEKEAMAAARNILFVAAAGNEITNNDHSPLFPASYDLPNIISVAASNSGDNLASFSNFGPGTVHVAAPGTGILSTLPENRYSQLSGTSMSTAFVSGLAALILARNPGYSPDQLKDRILRTADRVPKLEGRLITDGRINVLRALTEAVAGPEIFRINPARGRTDSVVSILGSSFDNTTGRILFSDNIDAEIISWRNDKIVCRVPEGAVSGQVRVLTSRGAEARKHFEVSIFPGFTRYSFPFAGTGEEWNQYLVLANIFDTQIIVQARAIGFSRDQVFRSITLRPYEQRILRLSFFGIMDDFLSIHLRSDEFFGATLLSLTDNEHVKPFHPLPWGPDSLLNFPLN